MDERRLISHFFKSLDPLSHIVAVCGARSVRERSTRKRSTGKRSARGSQKDGGEEESSCDEAPFKPLVDEWQLADFALFHHVLSKHPGKSDWLTSVDLEKYCEDAGSLLRGPPSQGDERSTVFTSDDEPFYRFVRSLKLAREFRSRLNTALRTAARVLIIFVAHGFEENGGGVYLGRDKFFARDLQFIVPSRLSGGAVTVLTTSCHGGSFISPKWTTFVAVPSQHLSLSFSRSKSVRNRG